MWNAICVRERLVFYRFTTGHIYWDPLFEKVLMEHRAGGGECSVVTLHTHTPLYLHDVCFLGERERSLYRCMEYIHVNIYT